MKEERKKELTIYDLFVCLLKMSNNESTTTTAKETNSKYYVCTEVPNEKTNAPFLINFGGPNLRCSVAPYKGAMLTSYSIKKPSTSSSQTDSINNETINANNNTAEFIELLFRWALLL